jgi:Na+/H+-dicarboxylate symporter
MKKIALHWQILAAIALAVIAGLLTGKDGTLFGVQIIPFYQFIGTLFLNALKMVVVPLVLAGIITGIAGIGGGDKLGRMGIKAIGYYMLTTLFAVLVGLAVVNITKPGIIDGKPAAELLNLTTDQQELDSAIQQVEGGRRATSVFDVIMQIVPANIITAAAQGQMMALIFFGILFGFFITRINPERGALLRNFWQGVFDVMILITMWVMKFAPIGVFGLVAKTVAMTGFGAFKPLLIFFVTVVAGLAIHALVVLPLMLRLIGRVRPYLHLRLMSPVLLTAFSTASSSATLPLTLDALENKVGVSNRTTGFVLPLGATINMDGTALYECVAAMFIAQAAGIHLDFVTQFTVVLLALLTSIGVAGIPAASLVAISIILGAVGLPLEAIGVLLVTDRVLDMLRTAVNVFSDASGTVIVARLEGEATNVGIESAAFERR